VADIHSDLLHQLSACPLEALALSSSWLKLSADPDTFPGPLAPSRSPFLLAVLLWL
jgi:hypothetical protein